MTDRPEARPPPRWAAWLYRVAESVLGGTRSGRGVALNLVINLHKGVTGVVILVLMQAYDVFSTAAWVYLALHGSYGIAWVMKDVALGDRKWRRRVGVLGVVGSWAFLTLYWVAPWLLVLGQAGELELGGWTPAGSVELALAVVVYVVGLVLMIGADAQKNAILAVRERAGLITTGFYARTRHPNYLGEMLIYGSFAVVVSHWLPWVILGAVWLFLFVPTMLVIDASLSRYPGYEAWKARTGFLLPRIGRRR